jgi:large subunit ribosomal protein L35
VKEYGLDGAGRGGGGAHMWREIWDESVTRIYQDLLREWYSLRLIVFLDLSRWSNAKDKPEPVFGKPRRADPYRNEDGTKPSKYLLSTVGVEEPEVVDASGIRASS